VCGRFVGRGMCACFFFLLRAVGLCDDGMFVVGVGPPLPPLGLGLGLDDDAIDGCADTDVGTGAYVCERRNKRA